MDRPVICRMERETATARPPKTSRIKKEAWAKKLKAYNNLGTKLYARPS